MIYAIRVFVIYAVLPSDCKANGAYPPDGVVPSFR